MRILVTGGAGFIGSNLTRQLLAEGNDVTVLDDLSSGYQRNIDNLSGVDFVRGDVRDAKVMAEVTAGRQAVFHLAASVGNKRSIDNPLLDSEINVIGTLRVLEASLKAGVRKIVVSSSAGIFGELKTLPIREDHPVEPDSPHGASKLCAEKHALAYAKLYGIEVVCLRYFNVYGPGQCSDAYGNVIPILVSQMLRGESVTVFGDGEQTRDFISVRDVVQANIKAAMVPGVCGAFNIGSGTQTGINTLVEGLAKAAGLKPSVRHGPARAGDVRDSLADIGAARRAFGFEPQVNLQQGLPEYIRWARSELAS